MRFPFVSPSGAPVPLEAETRLTGGVFPLLFKYGPVIGRVTAPRRGPGLELEGGQTIEVLGQRLQGARLYANTEELEITAADGERLRAWLPARFTGLVWLEARTPEGSHTVRIMTRAPFLRD
jgi:hypothetical protein